MIYRLCLVTENFISPELTRGRPTFNGTSISGPIPTQSSGPYYSTSHPNLGVIKFAGASRFLLSYVYNGKQRLVEPYSIRQRSTGNILFYGWELSSGQIKAFIVDQMQSVESTNQTFRPRFQGEFN